MALDVLITLTDFVRVRSLLEYSGEGRDFSKSGFPEAGKLTEEQRVFDPNRTKRSMTNILRRIILRITPYISPTSSP